MAKLYAELTSDKGGRVASKSGDQYITIDLRAKNKQIGQLELYLHSDGEWLITYQDHDERKDKEIIKQGQLT